MTAQQIIDQLAALGPSELALVRQKLSELEQPDREESEVDWSSARARLEALWGAEMALGKAASAIVIEARR